MMDVILNKDKKQVNGHHGSNSNIPSAAGGLPGVRSRTRGTNGQDRLQTNNSNMSSPNITNTGGIKLSTDEMVTEDENGSFDLLVKSTLSMPKGQPPKKRTKKYGDRKSCKLIRPSFVFRKLQ
jgi:hypothetical protein